MRELLSQHGAVVSLWMPTIKNLAYVVYESADVAEETRCAHDIILYIYILFIIIFIHFVSWYPLIYWYMVSYSMNLWHDT